MINFKELAIGSLMNLGVFVAKPIIMICTGKLKDLFKNIKKGNKSIRFFFNSHPFQPEN